MTAKSSARTMKQAIEVSTTARQKDDAALQYIQNVQRWIRGVLVGSIGAVAVVTAWFVFEALRFN